MVQLLSVGKHLVCRKVGAKVEKCKILDSCRKEQAGVAQYTRPDGQSFAHEVHLGRPLQTCEIESWQF